LRAALYGRVSTEEQAEKYGLASQISELRAYAKRKHYTVADGGEFLDDGYSGADLERPALNRLREAIRAKAFQVVLIHDPDRLSRKLAHQLLLTEEFERAAVELEFVTVSKEATPEGRLLLQVKGVIAEYEREKIRERTSRGRKEKARRGLVVTGPYPYGYRPDPAQPGRLIIHPEEADVVRMIYRWLVDEHRSIRSIVTELRRLGILPRRGREWAKSSVRKLLTSPFYAGQAHYNRREKIVNAKTGRQGTGRRFRPESEWIPISVPAIVDEALFARAQEQLGRNRGTQTGRPPVRFYLLRGLLRCGGCSRKVVGTPSHGRRIYRCSGRDRLQGRERCRARTVSAERFETFIWETVVGILRNPQLLAEKLEAHHTRLGVREVELKSEVEHLDKQVRDLERQEQRLLDLYLAEGLAVASVRERLEEFARRRKGLEERLGQAKAMATKSAAEESRQGSIRRYCAQALRGLEKLDPDGRQRLLRALIDEIVLKDDAVEIHGVLPGRWAPEPARNRAQQQDVVAAGRGDLQCALGVRLPAHVGQIQIFGRSGRRRRRRRHGWSLAIEQRDGITEGGRTDHLDAAHSGRFRCVVAGDEQRANALSATGEADREGTADPLDLTVERQLADNGDFAGPLLADEPDGGQDSQRDRQVERGAFLAEIGGSEAHRDPLVRHAVSRVPDGRAHALAAFPYGGVRETDGGKGR
jgi:site-specific DNA recombinase